MTLHDDLATLRNVLSLGDTALRQASDYALTALSRVEAEIARLTEDRDTRMRSQFRLQDERDLAIQRAEAAEAEIARLGQERDALLEAAKRGLAELDYEGLGVADWKPLAAAVRRVETGQ